jgi:hypothetical protein
VIAWRAHYRVVVGNVRDRPKLRATCGTMTKARDAARKIADEGEDAYIQRVDYVMRVTKEGEATMRKVRRRD